MVKGKNGKAHFDVLLFYSKVASKLTRSFLSMPMLLARSILGLIPRGTWSASFHLLSLC